MRFAHLSDFHYTEDARQHPELRSGLVDALSRIFDDLAGIQQHLDFVSLTGDLAEAGDTESYIALQALFDRLDIPVLAIPGNHDSRQAFSAVLSTEFNVLGRATFDYHTSVDGIQIIGLDTLVSGQVGGRLTQEQLSWLEDLLLSDGFSHSVVSMHHPPFTIGQDQFDAISSLEGRDAFGALLRQSRSEVIVLSGHIHRPYQARWNQASCHIAGAPSLQMGASFCFGGDPLTAVDEPFAYFIHDIDKAAGHRVGTRYLSLD